MSSISISEVKKHLPDQSEIIQDQLAKLFDRLIDLIIKKLMLLEKEKFQDVQLHFLLKEEQTFELARLMEFLNSIIVAKEIELINFKNYDIEKEKQRIFDNTEKIDNTAEAVFQAIWEKLYIDSWIPKTKKLLDNQPKIQKTKIINKVNDNHFITKSFIKRYWSDENLQIVIYPKNNLSEYKKANFGKFGKKQNIYSDELEGYFHLLENDVTRHPFSKQNLFEKLIHQVPMNRLEKESLIGFIIIHYLRNPYSFKKRFEELMSQNNINTEKYSSQKLYETIFQNNELYAEMTKNILLNSWVLMKSENEAFVLPDTAVYYKKEEKGQIILFPISSMYCLIITPFEDVRNEKEKIIFKKQTLTFEESLVVTNFLIQSSYEKFVASDKLTQYFELLSDKSNSTIYDVLKIIKENKNSLKNNEGKR